MVHRVVKGGSVFVLNDLLPSNHIQLSQNARIDFLFKSLLLPTIFIK